jgi:hypothetical protein
MVQDPASRHAVGRTRTGAAENSEAGARKTEVGGSIVCAQNQRIPRELLCVKVGYLAAFTNGNEHELPHDHAEEPLTTCARDVLHSLE